MSTFYDTWQQHRFGDVTASIGEKTAAEVGSALARARAGGRLGLDDLAALLSPAAVPFLEEMAQLSHQRTVERFGHTIQLFAPLYLTNVCANVCTYCGFSAQNRIPRKVLNDDEIRAEAAVLRSRGIEHVLFVTGESKHASHDYFANALRLLRPSFANLSMEVQPISEAEYASLAREGLSAVIVFQETYDPEAYVRYHLKGPKADMRFRLETPDRLGRAGLKKIGLGALYGLSEWRTDAWFLGLHLQYLEKNYWRSRLAISFPRLRPHAGAEIQVTPTSERNLVQAFCAYRLFSPEVELTLSTRESPRFRNHAIRLGVTSMSAEARTNPGGYAAEPESLEQFAIHDTRTTPEVAAYLRSQGYTPVFKDWDSVFDSDSAFAGAKTELAG
ncbi:2-iminoacetate synthase ThiH [Opitutus sp. ER46]|uniref:2-iminoacetate synthase ThiH n=1 Tax=Opitutus sp. ER46 TaxID=2161864 RepID=UPI000D302CF7|nr:2-iminoacetate synthase ThiH [Opitutus sp. ER46]PTX97688.1 2-iminoacetate synthase ThiH [Opitutus sp. ER46]